MSTLIDLAQHREARREAARLTALGAELEALATLGQPIDTAARASMREAVGPDNLWAVPVERWDKT